QQHHLYARMRLVQDREDQIRIECPKIDGRRREQPQINGDKVICAADLHTVSGEVEQRDIGILSHDAEAFDHFVGGRLVEINEGTTSHQLEPELLECRAYGLCVASWIVQSRSDICIVADNERYPLLRNSLVDRRAQECNCK